MNGTCKLFSLPKTIFFCGLSLAFGACLHPKAATFDISVPSLKHPPLQFTKALPQQVLPEKVDQKLIKQVNLAVDTAWQMYRRGDYEGALQQLTKSLAVYPLVSKANVLLGKIYLVKACAKPDEAWLPRARELFTMATELDPSDTEAKLLLQLTTKAESLP